jgi:hypothetical protein
MGRWHGPGQYVVESFVLAEGGKPRQQLREQKRREAEERNEHANPERRRANRRQLDARLADSNP